MTGTSMLHNTNYTNNIIWFGIVILCNNPKNRGWLNIFAKNRISFVIIYELRASMSSNLTHTLQWPNELRGMNKLENYNTSGDLLGFFNA